MNLEYITEYANWYNGNKDFSEKMHILLQSNRKQDLLDNIKKELEPLYTQSIKLYNKIVRQELGETYKINKSIPTFNLNKNCSFSQPKGLSEGNTYQIDSQSKIKTIFKIQFIKNSLLDLHSKTSTLLKLSGLNIKSNPEIECTVLKTFYIIWQALSELDNYNKLIDEINKNIQAITNDGNLTTYESFTLLNWYYNRKLLSNFIEKYTNFVSIYISIRNIYKDGHSDLIYSASDGLKYVVMKDSPTTKALQQVLKPKQVKIDLQTELQSYKQMFGPFKSFDNKTFKSDLENIGQKTLLITYGYSGTGKTHNIKNLIDGVDDPCVKVFYFNHDIKASNNKLTSIETTMDTNYIESSSFSDLQEKMVKADYIRKTPNNPDSSRAFLLLKSNIKNLHILDMAGHESPQWFINTLIPTMKLNDNLPNVERDSFYQPFKRMFTNERNPNYTEYKLTDNAEVNKQINFLLNRLLDRNSKTFKAAALVACWFLINEINIDTTDQNNTFVTELKTFYTMLISYMHYLYFRFHICKTAIRANKIVDTHNNSIIFQVPTFNYTNIIDDFHKYVKPYVPKESVKEKYILNHLNNLENMDKKLPHIFKPDTIRLAKDALFTAYLENPMSDKTKAISYYLKIFELYCRESHDVQVDNVDFPFKITEKILSFHDIDNRTRRLTHVYEFSEIIKLLNEAKEINEANTQLQTYMKTKKIPDNPNLLIQYIAKKGQYSKIIMLANIRDDDSLYQRYGAYKSLEYVQGIKST